MRMIMDDDEIAITWNRVYIDIINYSSDESIEVSSTNIIRSSISSLFGLLQICLTLEGFCLRGALREVGRNRCT